MAELIKSKRAFFPRGEQEKFIRRSQRLLGLSLVDLAVFLGISPRTVFDWQREKFSMSYGAVRKILKRTKQQIRGGIKIKDRWWYVSSGARKGGQAVYKKYGSIGGDPRKREKRWRQWWNKHGRFKKSFIGKKLSVRLPRKSENLAEFVGILMGDGGISKYQITISLHRKDDKEYSKFVVDLIKKLFKINPGISDNVKKNVRLITISRQLLVKYLKGIGLPIGHKIKHHLDIPFWIKSKERFAIACLRGLMDTDGSLFNHNYKVKGKYYHYKKLSFTSASLKLRKSVYRIFKNLGFKPRFAQDKDVRLDSTADVKRFFSLIKTNNPKYLKRYLK